MAEFPALQLWTDAYLGDTLHLSTIEHGAYLLLLMAAWRSKDCRLPDDDRLLAKYARLTPGQWARIKPTIAAFYTIENGFWVQGRLTDERDAVRRKSERGKAGADAKWLKHNKARHAQASDKHMPNAANHNHNHNHEDTSVSSPPIPRQQRGGFDLPDWVPEAEWLGFCEMRRSIKAPLTDRAKGSILRTLERLRDDGHPPGRVLDQSTTNSWRGVFELKDGTNDKRGLGGHQGDARAPQYRRDPAWDAFKALRDDFAADPDGWGGDPLEGYSGGHPRTGSALPLPDRD